MENLYNLNNYLNRRQEKFQRTLQREANHTLRRDTLRRNRKEPDIPEFEDSKADGKLLNKNIAGGGFMISTFAFTIQQSGTMFYQKRRVQSY